MAYFRRKGAEDRGRQPAGIYQPLIGHVTETEGDHRESGGSNRRQKPRKMKNRRRLFFGNQPF
jgi:hypothetical protein